MINKFENETAPLNKIELSAAAIIASALYKFHIGEEKAVNAQHICNSLAERFPQYRTTKQTPYLTGARIRKIINHIRINNLCPNVVASSKGYYVSNNAQELQEYVQSLRQRAAAINAVADALDMQNMQMAENMGKQV